MKFCATDCFPIELGMGRRLSVGKMQQRQHNRPEVTLVSDPRKMKGFRMVVIVFSGAEILENKVLVALSYLLSPIIAITCG